MSLTVSKKCIANSVTLNGPVGLSRAGAYLCDQILKGLPEGARFASWLWMCLSLLLREALIVKFGYVAQETNEHEGMTMRSERLNRLEDYLLTFIPIHHSMSGSYAASRHATLSHVPPSISVQVRACMLA